MRDDMKTVSPISRLINAIERGRLTVPQFVDLCSDCDFLPGDALRAYNGSLDAAAEFQDMNLPGAWSRISGPWDGEWSAKVYPPGTASLGYYGSHPLLPSRAWLIATLRAMGAVQ